MKEFWKQLTDASGALIVLMGVAGACYTFGVTQRPRIGVRDAVAAHRIYVDSLDAADRRRALSQDSAIAVLGTAVNRLSRQVCLLDARIANRAPTKECAQ